MDWAKGNWRKAAFWAVVALLVVVISWEGREFYDASTQHDAEYRYQPASKPGFRIDASSQSPTPHYKPSCNNPNKQEDADLCAQWAAVQQVTETNRLASLAVRISVFALLFAVLGTALLVWTFWETRETSRAELRAYVLVKTIEIETLAVDEPFAIRVTFTNTGQTPAFNMAAQHRLFISAQPYPENFANLEPAVSSGMLGPNAEGYAHMRIALLDNAAMGTIIDGSRDVLVLGKLSYKDIFGRPHTTTFRQKVRVVAAPNDTYNFTFEVCAEGNSAD